MKPFLLIFLMLIKSFSFSQETDLQKRSLKGNIKEISYSNFNVTVFDGQYQKGEKINESFSDDKSIAKFNSHGNVFEETFYQNNGEIRKVIFYKYNKQNKLVEIEKGINGNERFEYNDEGMLLNHFKFDKNNRLVDFTSYLYDQTNRLIEERHKNSTSIFLYNPKNQIIKLEKFTNDEIWWSNFSKSQHASTDYIDYIYDLEGRVSKKIYVNNSIVNENSFLYDNLGNLIVETSIIDKKNNGNSFSTNTRKNIYKYDNKGNWVVRIQIINDAPVSFDERIIEYY